MIPKTSVERVRAALLAAGHPDTITEFPAGTRTAADAAAAVGCRWRRSPSRSCSAPATAPWW